MAKRSFFLGIMSVACTVGTFVACNGDMLSKAAGAGHGAAISSSLGADTPQVDQSLNGELTKRWREPVVFDADSNTFVSRDSIARYVKRERQRRRDSLRIEFDKRPKHVYFTFDDGPLVGSRAIDSIVSAKNVKISTFLVGKHAGMSKGLRRAFERYESNKLVECYNHSFTHANNKFTTFYSNPVGAFDDFAKNEDELALTHKIVRLPGRNIWIYDEMRRIDLQSGASTADLLFNEGYKIFGWDVEWKIHGLTGKPIQSVEEIFTRLRNYMNNKSSMEPNNVVLLMHDDMFQSKHGQQLLSNLIDTLQKNTDYSFEFMSSYPFRY